jgi:outer membrane receptor for ferrienterochelin and colicin
MRAATSPEQVALPTSGMTCYGQTIRFVNRGAFNFAHFTNDNISRIEVIREPQSALYGSQASGGVINLITRRGEGRPTGSVYFERSFSRKGIEPPLRIA